MEGSQPRPLDENKLVAAIAKDGPLARSFAAFEARRPQQEMLQALVRGYNRGSITLIEAGTGTGKSLAYLLPALTWALRNNECTLISTNTIALQEQLLHKDIPLLAKALNLDCKVVLVKGMSNYLCLRKLKEIEEGFMALLEPLGVIEELKEIGAWSQNTQDGSKATLAFRPQPQVWEKVCAESDACGRDGCPFFNDCFFFKARRAAQEAHLLICNHHLLFTDLAQRAEQENYKASAVLPLYHHVIVDEAHNLEEIATTYLALRCSNLQLLHLLNKLSSDSEDRTPGKLAALTQTISKRYPKGLPTEAQKLLQTIHTELFGERVRLTELLAGAFHALYAFALAFQGPPQDTERAAITLRLRDEHLHTVQWKESVIPAVTSAVEASKRYLQTLAGLLNDLKESDDEKLAEKTKGLVLDINALRSRLEKDCSTLSQIILTPANPELVRWIEAHYTKNHVYAIHVVEAALDVAPRLVETFFSKFASIALCSATLATNRTFSFCRKRLGLTTPLTNPERISEGIFDSPFDFARQSLLLVPNDLPLPSHPLFLEKACYAISEALSASRGNAFLLFTSYAMLQTCYRILEPVLTQRKLHLLQQGAGPRHLLLEQFRSQRGSVLFGTDSFWEGVDVAGEALRCVVIAKLPFKVPTEPITEARSQAIRSKGGDPFSELSLPQAIVKFKQGFGRLIRHRKDRGCVVCLDSRLVTRSYGEQFLQSLPPCPLSILPVNQLKEAMELFYRNTYHLVKSGSP